MDERNTGLLHDAASPQLVRDDIAERLRAYARGDVDHPFGSFLELCVRGDFRAALRHAVPGHQRTFVAIVAFLEHELPRAAWGSDHAVDLWRSWPRETRRAKYAAWQGVKDDDGIPPHAKGAVAGVLEAEAEVAAAVADPALDYHECRECLATLPGHYADCSHWTERPDAS